MTHKRNEHIYDQSTNNSEEQSNDTTDTRLLSGRHIRRPHSNANKKFITSTHLSSCVGPHIQPLLFLILIVLFYVHSTSAFNSSDGSNNLISTFDIFRNKDNHHQTSNPASTTTNSPPPAQFHQHHEQPPPLSSTYSASLPVIVSKSAPEPQHEQLNHSPEVNPYNHHRPVEKHHSHHLHHSSSGSDVADQWSPSVTSHYDPPVLPKQKADDSTAIEHDIRDDLLDTMKIEPYEKFLEPDNDSYKQKMKATEASGKDKERPDVSVTIYHHQAIHDPLADYGSGKPWNFFGNGYGVHYGYDLDGNYSRQKGYQFEKAHGRDFCKEGHACKLDNADDKTKVSKQISSKQSNPLQKHIFNVIKNENVDVNQWFDKDNPNKDTHSSSHNTKDDDEEENDHSDDRPEQFDDGSTGDARNYRHYNYHSPMVAKRSRDSIKFVGEDPIAVKELSGNVVTYGGHQGKLVDEHNLQHSLEFAEPEENPKLPGTTVPPARLMWPSNMKGSTTSKVNPSPGLTVYRPNLPRPTKKAKHQQHFEDRNTNYFAANPLEDTRLYEDLARTIPLTTTTTPFPGSKVRVPLLFDDPVLSNPNYRTINTPTLSRISAASPTKPNNNNLFAPTTSANVYQKSAPFSFGNDNIFDDHNHHHYHDHDHDWYYPPSDPWAPMNSSWTRNNNNNNRRQNRRSRPKKRLTSKYQPINGIIVKKNTTNGGLNRGQTIITPKESRNYPTQNPYSK